MKANTLQDVWKRVEAVESGCWLWGGSTRNGYGVMKVRQRQRQVHVIVWELFAGPVPTGLELDHLCRVRACVNPAHLEPVTPHTNILRSNGLAAINARKTHCPKGHLLAGDNLALLPRKNDRTARRCLACHRISHNISQRRQRARQRQAVAS